MVLFRDRFRLVAPIYRNRPFTFVQRHFGDVHPKCAYGTCTSPRSGTKFAHALIKYRLSQMSLHRIHHPPQKAVHDTQKPRCPRHARSQLGLCDCFYVFSPMNLLLSSFRLREFPGFPTFSPTRLLPFSFRLGDFSGFPTFPQKRHKKGCPKLTVR